MEEEPRLVAVVNVMRHSHNKGDALTERGHALAFKRGEEAGHVLLGNSSVRRAIKKNGITYMGSTSPTKRAVQTEERYQEGLFSNPQIMKALKGVGARRSSTNPLIRTPERLSDSADAIMKDQKLGEELLQRVFDGEPQEHLEGRESLESRMAPMQEFVDALSKFAKTREGAASPVFFVNYVSHGGLGKAPGMLDMFAQTASRKKIGELGGPLTHTEGLQFYVYGDGSVKTRMVRQNPEKSRWL
jgi:hypothetical protein